MFFVQVSIVLQSRNHQRRIISCMSISYTFVENIQVFFSTFTSTHLKLRVSNVRVQLAALIQWSKDKAAFQSFQNRLVTYIICLVSW